VDQREKQTGISEQQTYPFKEDVGGKGYGPSHLSKLNLYNDMPSPGKVDQQVGSWDEITKCAFLVLQERHCLSWDQRNHCLDTHVVASYFKGEMKI